MPRGRPTKFSPEKGQHVIERLRAGCTRTAAAESVGVWCSTLSDWLDYGREAKSGPFHDFYNAVLCAEADAETRNTAIVEKAAAGWDAGSTTTTRKTVFKTKKTKLKDGTVIEEPVAFEEVTTSETREREFDWRAALEWLKRRRPDEWGDKIDVRQLPDDRLVRMLNRAAEQRSREAGDPAPAGTSNGNGH